MDIIYVWGIVVTGESLEFHFLFLWQTSFKIMQDFESGIHTGLCRWNGGLQRSPKNHLLIATLGPLPTWVTFELMT